ncbi:NADH-quinone oxidoreductase subunit A [Natronoglycomyces albus]|uniref:NADH-quinone oxidoreductase subunit A n=1 Tax=Natronoglycomyces albus TaxID=2811108 RepID=A0A895XH71_9ACTN|nr:NADH-quinone oxidoreductase subunit A [Natronoglycomyces albus]QSB04694.1 NADH-quinone oxidoreductase subunit A [Natronoglycomyces albus]
MAATYLHSYLTLGLLLAVGIGFVFVASMANWLLRRNDPSAAKAETYECGVDPVGSGWAQVEIRYYVYAFLFVLFAVEAVFIFPWAVVFADFGLIATVEMGIFVGVLALGLAYAWRKGVLKWQ